MTQTNLYRKWKQIMDIENRPLVGMGLGENGWDVIVSRCKLLCIEWINKKVLLYSIGNDIQYAVINHNEKEHKNIYISDQISHSIVSDSLPPYELQHSRPPCPSPTPGVHSDSRPSSQ